MSPSAPELDPLEARQKPADTRARSRTGSSSAILPADSVPRFT
jgi:hypothetical protein